MRKQCAKLMIAGTSKVLVTAELINELTFIYNLLGPCREIVIGYDKDMDQVSKEWADLYQTMEIKQFTADKIQDMLQYADGLLLIWDGISKRSAKIKEDMIKLDKPVFEMILRRNL